MIKFIKWILRTLGLFGLMEKLLKPIRKLLNAIKEWIRKLPLPVRISIAIVIIAIIVVVYYPIFIKYYNESQKWTSWVIRVPKVWIADARKFPLRGSDRERLNNSSSHLIFSLNAKLDQQGDFAAQAWTTSQILVAMEGRIAIDAKSAHDYLNSQIGPDCPCWRKYPQIEYPPNIAISAWVLFALARLRQSASTDQLRFILDNQKSDGWWPIYPASNSPENASTYATALSILALYEQLDMDLVKEGYKNKVEGSINLGSDWLILNRVEGKARWKDYPLGSHPPGKESLSISGLVLHVLHHTNQTTLLNDIDHIWLQNLPSTIPSPVEFEASNKTIFQESEKPIQTDDTRYYPLPWIIIATVDAYPTGTIKERTTALAWTERVLKLLGTPEEIEVTALKAGDWIAAELLIALRYLSEKGIEVGG